MKKVILFLTVLSFPVFLSTTFVKYSKENFLYKDIKTPSLSQFVFYGEVSIKKMPQGWLSVSVTDNSLSNSSLFILQSDTNYDVSNEKSFGIVKYFGLDKRVEIELPNKKMIFALSNNYVDNQSSIYYGYGIPRI